MVIYDDDVELVLGDDGQFYVQAVQTFIEFDVSLYKILRRQKKY